MGAADFLFMTSLEPKQKQQLDQWIEEVREHEHSALKWAALLYKIKESGYWKAQAASWPDFCFEVFGYSRDKAYRYVACGEALEEHKEEFQKDPPKSLRQVKARSVARVQQPILEYVGTENDKEVKMARQDQDHETLYAKPPEPPRTTPVAKTVVTVSAWNELHAILRYANQLQNSEAAFMGDKFRRLVGMLKAFESHIQMNLPGIMEQVPNKGKSRGTQQEVVAFCESLGLLSTDGDWFFFKCEGCEWKNAGKPIKDWQMTCRAWKLANYFPSQKLKAIVNAKALSGPKPDHVFDLDREIARAKKEGLM